jgi:ABC-2 type transport system ATP-binding protein
MILLDRVRKAYATTVAVDGLSLRVAPGEIFGLLGPNGAGKSTTISMIVGLLRPDSGSVRVDGGDPAEPSVRARIGVAPQALALYDDLTGRENLAFFGATYGLSGRERLERADELLDLVGLADRGKDKAKAYSGGMKRRLNLAAALVHRPRLILLDEPTAGVDPQSRAAIFAIVEELREGGATVVYTTHYMEEAQRLCDRVAIMDHGRLLALDTVEGLIGAHGGESVVRVRRRERDEEERVHTGEPLTVIAAALKTGDATSVAIDRPDLEAVFLRLTGRSLRD